MWGIKGYIRTIYRKFGAKLGNCTIGTVDAGYFHILVNILHNFFFELKLQQQFFEKHLCVQAKNQQ